MTRRKIAVVITARASMRDYFEAQGADDFITKPVSPDELIAKVRAVMALPPRAAMEKEKDIPPQPITPEVTGTAATSDSPPESITTACTSTAPQKKNPLFSDVSIYFLYGASVLIFIVIFVINCLTGK